MDLAKNGNAGLENFLAALPFTKKHMFFSSALSKIISSQSFAFVHFSTRKKLIVLGLLDKLHLEFLFTFLAKILSTVRFFVCAFLFV